ncbi:MAG: sugar transporter permease [Paenibacillaceae bacterium]|jgi:putative aldouronate transport system permease protein|nr:sugar transporter permease [Paenibacillaceae bacterium]
MKKTGWNDRIFVSCNYFFLSLLLLIVLYPLIYLTSASISNPTLVNTGEMWLLPKDVTLEGYTRVFQNRDIWTGYLNTIFYTVAGTLINLLVTLPCAYALARRGLAGRKIVMTMLLLTMFFNGGVIPTFLLVKSLGLINTVWALLLPSAAAAWNIVITRTFFQNTIPRELEEAAEIDGCSNFRLFASVILPLSAPIIAVMSLFYGVGHWNQYFSALLYLKDRGLYPLQLFLREILVLNEMNATMMMDGADIESVAEQARIAEIIKYAIMIVSALPLIIAYPFMQRFFLKGVMVGSLKG